MFKEIKLPVNTEKVIDLSAIKASTNGIIIGFSNNIPICYIQATDGEWQALNSLYYMNIIEFAETLQELVTILISKKEIDSVKLIEFK